MFDVSNIGFFLAAAKMLSPYNLSEGDLKEISKDCDYNISLLMESVSELEKQDNKGKVPDVCSFLRAAIREEKRKYVATDKVFMFGKSHSRKDHSRPIAATV